VLSSIVGGIAIFLIGMTLLTDGVKAAAGDALRRTLTRLTGGAFRAFISGAAITALVQSSTVTTLATIGFVSAGLLTFSQAVGLVIGANVGTTSTGWLVSLLGLHVNVTSLAVPLVGIGALLRLLGRGRAASTGLALAGFGLLFIGIGWLQTGMSEFSAAFDLSRLRTDSVAGSLILLGAGIAMTVVMQSSSAAVATTLTALHAGAITLPQAAILVIGQNVGTTATAAIAMIGASTPAKRTGAAHILFNLVTAAVALLLLPVIIPITLRAQVAAHISAPVAIAAFHTLFNLLGAALVLPFASRFALFVTRLVPARGPRLTSRLDQTVSMVSSVAVESARLTTLEIADELRLVVRQVLDLGDARGTTEDRLAACDRALDETRRFLASVRSPVESAEDHARHVAVLHALDHLERIVSLVRAPVPRSGLRCSRAVIDAASVLNSSLETRAEESGEGPAAAAGEVAARIAASRRLERPRMLQRTASGEFDPDAAIDCLDAMRWVENLAYHWWRAMHHLYAPLSGRTPADAPLAVDAPG
jgi:phosphate:Na+ symporter